jgi:hypothetical protein
MRLTGYYLNVCCSLASSYSPSESHYLLLNADARCYCSSFALLLRVAVGGIDLLAYKEMMLLLW